MGEMIDSPQAIYPQILAEIDKLLDALGNQSDNQEIEEYRKSALAKLDGVHNDILENIQSLQKNSEWDVFTVAFYGETNAGKSTLIEIL